MTRAEAEKVLAERYLAMVDSRYGKTHSFAQIAAVLAADAVVAAVRAKVRRRGLNPRTGNITIPWDAIVRKGTQ